MKTLKMNRIKYLYLVMLITVLGTAPFIAQSQKVEYWDNSFAPPLLIATSDSRFVFSVEETETTVKLRVMMLGDALVYLMTPVFTYDPSVLTLTDRTYTDNVEYFFGDQPNFCSEMSPKCAADYPKYYPNGVQVGDLSAGGKPTGGKFFYIELGSTYMGPFREHECIKVPTGDLYPIMNIFFKKKFPGVKVKKEDFGFLADDGWMFDLQTQFGISPYMILIDYAYGAHTNPVTGNNYYPELFVFRSPSDVVIDLVSNVEVTSATLNANYTRGNLPPADDVYISSRTSCQYSGLLDWDTVSHYGFFYATTNATVSVNDITNKITVNSSEYPFPSSAEIAANGATGITIGGVEFFFVEHENTFSGKSIVYDADITGINTIANEYFAWTFIRYAFETSNTYLRVDGPVRFKKLLDCAALNNRYVPEDEIAGPQTYTHMGTNWDATALPLITLDSMYYVATGASPAKGTSLNNVVFPSGQTVVKWIGWLDELSDTCEFTVTVGPKSFLNCTLLSDKYVQEPYTHNDYSWDIQAKAGINLSDSTYVATGATTSTGKTLNGLTFNLGTTFVRWYAVNAADNSIDSCDFKVVVNPEHFMNCNLLTDHYYVQEDSLGYYEHHGAAWNAEAISTVALSALYYVAQGTVLPIPATGTNLNAVKFPIGTTKITWYGEDLGGNTDSCEFEVTVYPRNFANCAALQDRDVVETGATGYYKHSGAGWDVTAVAGETLTSKYYVAIDANPATGSTLDLTEFPLGVTPVKWYATIQNLGGGADFIDSCIFDVMVTPKKLVTCPSSLAKTAMENTPPGHYTHSGTDWDIAARTGVTLSAKRYELSAGGVLASNFTLDGATFPMGLTTVKYTVEALYTLLNGTTVTLYDTCEFTVTVIPQSFLNCGLLTDVYIQENPAGSGIYVHNDNTWNVKPLTGVTLTDSMAVLSGATILPLPGVKNLNGITFNLGTTYVKWYAINTIDAAKDSCEFTVTVNPAQFMACNSLPAHYYVQEDSLNYYQHHGAAWDRTAISTVALDTLYYVATGAVPAQGPDTLNMVKFPVGDTHVKWYGVDLGGNTDSCEFDVTVYPRNFLKCATLANRVVVETGTTGFYKHTNTIWDLEAITGVTLTSKSYTATGALPATGSTLNQTQLPIGVTTVKWYGIIQNLGGGANFIDSCDFTVTVHPSFLMDCDIFENRFVQEDLPAGSGKYSHTGIAWNPVARTGITLADTAFSLTGATTLTGNNTLNGVQFNLGTTTVRWIVTDNLGTADTCYFDVTVSPRSFLNCSVLFDRVVDETTPVGFYTYLGTAWNVTSPVKLKDSTYVYYIGAVQHTGKTLNGKLFPVGTTLVKWYAWDSNNFVDSCSFNVTVVPSNLVICPATPAHKNVPENGPVNYYTHAGNTWNMAPITGLPVTAITQTYEVSGVDPLATYTTLDGAVFPVGVNKVKYIVQATFALPAPGLPLVVRDSCEFNVTVNVLPLLNCSALSNKHMDESAPLHGYDHVGSGWDAPINSAAAALGLSITKHYEITIAGINYTGASLDGFNFPVGNTFVRWVATESTFGRTSTCSYTVTVDPLPTAVLDCSNLPNRDVSSDFAGATIYTHAGIFWDPLPGDPFLTTLVSLNYRLNGATTGTGAWTLDGVAFKLGKTTVTWTGKDSYGFVDSCKFVVTVIMNCPVSVAYEGGPYRVTSLAGLCWTDNMANTHYDGGAAIEFAKPYTCPTCPSNLETIFGLLYSWYSAVNVPEGSTTLPVPDANGHVQGICPNGFHVPSQSELNLLYLYPLESLKSKDYWIVPGTNATAFNALPAGRYNGATNRFEDMYGFTGWWTSYSSSDMAAIYHFINYYCTDITTVETLKSEGLSVRCIMDYQESTIFHFGTAALLRAAVFLVQGLKFKVQGLNFEP